MRVSGDITVTEIWNLSMLQHAISTFDRIMERNISSDEKKYLKYVRTYAMKYANAINERIDTKSKKRLKSKFKSHDVCFTPKELDGKYKRVTLAMDDFLSLAEEILELHCKGCDGSCKSECRIYEMFMDNMIPVFNPENEKMPCEYMYEVAPDTNPVLSAEVRDEIKQSIMDTFRKHDVRFYKDQSVSLFENTKSSSKRVFEFRTLEKR